ncbi:SGNH/GDSL hydrolase family protein [Mesorhizobium sp. IMUNJ 23232]|uniref:SGNH/GDSL hydrolase family protein n=1 Tax=Mesorhizobium sp. IMUNJ 23232 TaxID=3376064 RepID=UPI0037BC9196
MRKMMTAALAGAAFTASLVGFAAAQEDNDWIGTWTASAQPAWEADFAVPLGMQANLWNHTIRQVARVSIGGDKVRIIVSNEYGKLPLKIGAAQIGVTKDGAAIQPGTGKALTFSGSPSITIPPGAPVISDPVDLKVEPLSELSVSLFFPESAPATTMHWDGHQTAFIAAGNKVADEELKADSTQTQRAFLTGIMVEAPDDASAIVLFGDSITDGDGSTVDGNDRWPDTLAERLAQAGGAPVAVLNQGISGAKVLSDRMGVNALARFDRDVLNQPNADTVVLMMGINDIGWPGSGLALHDPEPTAEDIIAGYRQLIARAHADGMRIIGATLTPFGDSFAGTPFEGYYTPEKEKIRLAVNEFIRNSKEFDGVIDFDKVVVDPQKPGYIKPEFDKGDHLHPNAAGYDAMANSIDLKLLTGE